LIGLAEKYLQSRAGEAAAASLNLGQMGLWCIHQPKVPNHHLPKKGEDGQTMRSEVLSANLDKTSFAS
jgi:hypothetical protein